MIYAHNLENGQKIFHLIHVTTDVAYNLQECEGAWCVYCTDLI